MILIACGLIREAKLLSGPNILAIPGGGDAAPLEAALDDHLDRCPDITLVLSCGIAGALDPALKAGDIVVHTPPCSRESGNPEPQTTSPATLDSRFRGGTWVEALSYALSHARHGEIIGQDHIAATAAEKAALHATTGALAVDMETHIAARVAARHNVPFAAIRTISDTAHETLPPAALVGMNPDGSMALGRVLMSLARQPAQLPALIRTGRSAEMAFRALGEIGQHLRAIVARPVP